MPRLEADLTNVPTDLPLLREDVYEVQFVKCVQQRNKKNTGDVYEITLALTQPTIAVDGRSVNAGFPIIENLSITPTKKPNGSGGRTLEQIYSDLARIQECFLGEKRSAFDSDELLNQVGSVRLKHEVSEQYGTKARVNRWIKKSNA